MPYKEKPIEKRYFTVGEVAGMLDVQPSAIRYWIDEFDMEHAIKRRNDGLREYRKLTPQDVAKLTEIHRLLKVEMFTLQGAKRQLSRIKIRAINDEATAMLQKFGAKNAVELVAMAFRAGVISCLILLVMGCNQKLYDGMKKREPNKEVGR